jgi:hypothetical protein
MIRFDFAYLCTRNYWPAANERIVATITMAPRPPPTRAILIHFTMIIDRNWSLL